jgi:hypothetical protein
VVVLKHAFTLAELEADPGAAIELKEDIRDEAESIGTVTNVTLYDVRGYVRPCKWFDQADFVFCNGSGWSDRKRKKVSLRSNSGMPSRLRRVFW